MTTYTVEKISHDEVMRHYYESLGVIDGVLMDISGEFKTLLIYYHNAEQHYTVRRAFLEKSDCIRHYKIICNIMKGE